MVQGQQTSNGGGIFQQDLNPCHTERKVKTILKENHTKVLDWPENSPAVNPIENFRSMVKARLLKRDCTTKTKLTCGTLTKKSLKTAKNS